MTGALGRSRAAILAACIAVTVLASMASGAPTPEAVRQCVELNLPKYTNPGTAVVAQYADVETACRAALDDGDVSVQFEPGSSSGVGGDGGGSAPGAPNPGGEGAASAPGTADPSAGRGREDAPTVDGASRRADGGSTTTAGGRKDVVGRAIADAGDGAGKPLPTALSSGSVLAKALFGGALLIVVGAVAIAARRRLH